MSRGTRPEGISAGPPSTHDVPRMRLPGGRTVIVSRRSVVVAAGMAALAVVVVMLLLSFGRIGTPPWELWSVATGGGSKAQEFTLLENRLPRALVALGAGAALAASGALFQSVTRNPLGSPDVIGLGSGAAAGAVTTAIVFPGVVPVAIGAVAGALVAVVVVLGAAGGGTRAPLRMVVIGIGVNAMALAFVEFILSRARVEDALQAAAWLNGSLNARMWPDVLTIVVVLAALLPAALVVSRRLLVLEMGDEVSTALGVGPSSTRWWAVLVGVGLTAGAVLVVGPVAFVALVAPQIARRLTGAAGPGVAVAAVTGATLTVVADLAAQTVVPDTTLPVGIPTAAFGGVYLAYLLGREWKRGAV